LVDKEPNHHSHYKKCYYNNKNNKKECIHRGIVPFGVVIQNFGYVHGGMKKVINPIVGGRQYEQRKHCISKIIEMKR
jgi:hypothetical protein